MAEGRILRPVAAAMPGPCLVRMILLIAALTTVRCSGLRKLNATDVIDALKDLFILRGVPAFISFDNDPEFVALAVRDWVGAVGANTARFALGKWFRLFSRTSGVHRLNAKAPKPASATSC